MIVQGSIVQYSTIFCFIKKKTLHWQLRQHFYMLVSVKILPLQKSVVFMVGMVYTKELYLNNYYTWVEQLFNNTSKDICSRGKIHFFIGLYICNIIPNSSFSYLSNSPTHFIPQLLLLFSCHSQYFTACHLPSCPSGVVFVWLLHRGLALAAKLEFRCCPLWTFLILLKLKLINWP